MNYHLTLENIRGIPKGAIELSDTPGKTVTLLAGQIGSGKSSTILAVQACALGNAVPKPGLQKKDSKMLIHHGAKAGKAVMRWGEKTSTVSLTTGTHKGDKLNVSKYAAGLQKPIDIPTKELTELLQILPTREQLEAEVAQAEGLDIPTDDIWKSIEENGWDGAHKKAVNRRVELKREWFNLTGADFVASTARDFTPEHYVNETDEELQTGKATAQKLYEQALKAEAIDAKEQEDLKALAATFDARTKDVDDANAAHAAAEAELVKAQKLLTEIPKILNSAKAYECWHCKTLGVLDGDKMIQPPDATSEAEAAAIRLRVSQQEEAIRAARAAKEQAYAKVQMALSALSLAKHAQTKLNSIDLTVEAPAMTSQQALEEMRIADLKIKAKAIKAETDEIIEAIGTCEFIVSLLDPEGLRRNVAVENRTSFNELLEAICDAAGWPLIALDDGLKVTMRRGEYDTPYVLLSDGEMTACNVVLQIAFRNRDNSEMFIFDGIEHLKADNYFPGFKALMSMIQCPVVLGQMCNSKDEMMDVSDIGQAYWVQDGVIASQMLVEA